jgi:small acid-soluble spore protein H (minor)
MDVQQAQKIAVSPIMANVTYNGNRVYIEHVDQENQIATIHPLDNPNRKQSVPVTNLEQH